MEKITTLSIRENVFEQIRKSILNHQFKPGDKLIESELAEKLGVSRTPVREALHKLELEGLVEIHPRKYCLVKGITHECLIEINLIRSQLEPFAAKYAVDNLTDQELAHLEKLLDESVIHHEKRDVDNLMRVNDEFHQTIIKASRLNRIIKILENMHDYIVSFRRSFMSRPELVERSIREHREILLALKERDKEKVEALFIKHLKGISEYETVVLEDGLK
ncbi:MAG: GntR family transcriptional regulator [Brevibacillus sp.]|nr:GntR family transcriptional regulator [Brevibacillus sp.]